MFSFLPPLSAFCEHLIVFTCPLFSLCYLVLSLCFSGLESAFLFQFVYLPDSGSETLVCFCFLQDAHVNFGCFAWRLVLFIKPVYCLASALLTHLICALVPLLNCHNNNKLTWTFTLHAKHIKIPSHTSLLLFGIDGGELNLPMNCHKNVFHNSNWLVILGEHCRETELNSQSKYITASEKNTFVISMIFLYGKSNITIINAIQ